MRKIALFLTLVLSLSMFNGCEKRKITISQEFYDYAMEAIDIAEDYLAYRAGCDFKYTNYRFDDMEDIELPPMEGIDREIRTKEVEIWTKVVNLNVLFWAYDENPNTRDKVRERVNELKEILDGVVVGEVIINETQSSATVETTPSKNDFPAVFKLIDEYLYYRDDVLIPFYTTFNYNDSQRGNYNDYFMEVKNSFIYFNTLEIKNAADYSHNKAEDLYKKIKKSDCDEKCALLIDDCHSSYIEFYEFFVNPSGTYLDYCEKYKKLKMQATATDYRVNKYLESFGYERQNLR